MVLCEITSHWTLLQTWGILSVISFLFAGSMSAAWFVKFYWNPTYEMWKKKSNPKYPAPEKVREEITQMTKGVFVAAIAPSLAIWLSQRNISYGYCGFPSYSLWYELLSQLAFFLFLEFYEFMYHYSSHSSSFLWKFHKFHHKFPNPSPFAVIADEVTDQFVRALPMLIYPSFLNLNLDLMFLQVAFVLYGYGAYLHSGYEFDYPDAHHPFISSSFQHYWHHARSIIRVPYNCGFVLKVFDQLWGSVYKGECCCCKCCCKRGERSLEKWKEVVVPDYSVMLKWKFWAGTMPWSAAPVKW